MYSVTSRIGFFARHRDRENRRRVGILLLDRRLRDRARQQRQDAVDAVAHFLRGDVGVLLEPERDDDLRDALGRIRAELIDAADRVDGFLDLVGDFALDLLGRGARQSRGHGDGREVHLRQPIDAELAEGERADDDQREDEDRGKDRTADAEFSEPLHDARTYGSGGRARAARRRPSWVTLLVRHLARRP